jgi:hypothetical protein
MSKKELMSEMWISVDKRYPPTDTLQEILVYHEKTHEIYSPWTPHIPDMVNYMKGLKDGTVKRPRGINLVTCKEFTHWMPIYAPTGMESIWDVIHRDKREGTELWRQNMQRKRSTDD